MLDTVHQGLIERTWPYLNVAKLCTIFGYKNRPHNRIQAVSQAVLALAAKPQGFTVGELAEKTRQLHPIDAGTYTRRQASSDLMKLRSKKLVERIRTTCYYRIKSAGIRILAGLLTLREKTIKSVLAGLAKPRLGHPRRFILLAIMTSTCSGKCVVCWLRLDWLPEFLFVLATCCQIKAVEGL